MEGGSFRKGSPLMQMCGLLAVWATKQARFRERKEKRDAEERAWQARLEAEKKARREALEAAEAERARVKGALNIMVLYIRAR